MASKNFDTCKLKGVKVTEDIIGHGSYATVFKLDYLGLKCAGKKIHDVLQQGKTNNYCYPIRRFEEECSLLSQLHHPNIVQFLGVFFQHNDPIPILVMEFLPINLTLCIDRYGVLANEFNYSILNDVALGMHYLHSQIPPIVHRDLSSNNILLTSGMTAKISDLGVAKILNLNPQQISRMTQTPGTPAYMPPEVMVANPKYNSSVDVFSYGILMIHVISGQWPEPQIGQNRTDPMSDRLIPVTEAERREIFLRKIGNDHPAMDLILKCISNNPRLRVQSKEIIMRTADMVLQVPAPFDNNVEMHMRIKMDEDEKTSMAEKHAAEIQQFHDAHSEELQKVREDVVQKKNLQSIEIEKLINQNKTLLTKISQLTKQLKAFKEIVNSIIHTALEFVSGIDDLKDDSRETSDSEDIYNTYLSLQMSNAHCSDINTIMDTIPLSKKYFMAKYDYTEHDDSELSFRQGDIMCIFNADNQDWWLACCSKNPQRQGVVPSNYLANLNDEEWFYSTMTSREAKQHLMMPFNQNGSYMVWKKESRADEFLLAIKDNDTVTEYQINRLESGAYSIDGQLNFDTVIDLVHHYEQDDSGIVSHLLSPCILSVGDDLEIDRKRVLLMAKIGSGQSADVYKGVLDGTVSVAIKEVRQGGMSVRECLQEAHIMKKLQHPNLVTLYGVCSKEKPFYYVTELMEHGSLREYLRDKGKSLVSTQLIKLAMQVASGMTYLAEKNCIHRDLAARNVLVKGDLVCKITDFGLARLLEEDKDGYECTSVPKFPVKWTAPEAAMFNRFSIKSDVWSFGILLYEIITYGCLPYPGMSNAEVLEKVMQGYRMPCPTGCSSKFYKVMKDCWNDDSGDRPTFQALEGMLNSLQEELDFQQSHQIDRQELQLIKTLENGRFSEVWEGLWKDTSVAIKKLKPGISSNHECDIVMKLEHPNIIQCFGICFSDTAYIVFELMKHGDLLSYVRSEGKSFVLQQLLSMSSQIAAGMAYLHEHQCIHRDLAARNILVGERLVCKIADFGLAREISSEDIFLDGTGTQIPIKWTSPEAVMFSKFSTKSDVWSFGVLLWEIITYGYTPYPGMTNGEVLEKLGTGYRMSCPGGCPDQLYTIMVECWKDQPEQRPTFVVLEEWLQLVGAEESPKWEIDQQDVQLVKKLGAGEFSEVWEAYWKERTPIAVKMLQSGTLSTKEFLQEAHLLRSLQHQNLIQVYAICTTDSVFFVTELMKYGNLTEYLSGDGKGTIISQLINMSLQIAAGMAYLETKDIIHRNLAARSVMVGEDIMCKLANFGLAINRHTNEDIYSLGTKRKFPIKWTAPEAAMYLKFSTKSDVWSFGILLWEIITYGHFPYPDMTNAEVLSSIEKGYRLLCPVNCPDHLYSIMKECWSQDPATRPTFEALKTKLDNFIKEPKKGVEWEINKTEIQLSRKLGNGRHSEVWEGLWKGKTPVAVKCLKLEMLSAHQFLEEATMLKKLQHSHIIQLHGVCSEGSVPYIVTELMINGNLLEYLRNEGRSPTFTQLISMSLQVASGMIYLEEQGVIHRNLSAKNILVGENLVCKLANFRLAKGGGSDPYESLDRNKLSIKWTAPEAAVYNRFTTKSDVWSFGVVLYEIITCGQIPYPGMTFAETLEQVQQGYRMPQPKGCPDELYDIMLGCWKEKPEDRSTFKSVQFPLNRIFTAAKSQEKVPQYKSDNQ